MHFKRPIAILFILISTVLFGQDKAMDYTSCEGTLNIFRTQKYNLNFLGNTEPSTTFAEYPALSKITSGNQIWFSFIAPADGEISMSLESSSSNLSLLVFDTLFSYNICNEIKMGLAEIIRMVTPTASKKVGLSKNVNDSYLYPISIAKGKVLNFVVIADNKEKSDLLLDFKFDYTNKESTVDVKSMDFKKDRNAPAFTIKIIDKETRKPLISSIVIKGVKRYEGFFRTSELIFDAYRCGKLEYSCEHEGYFQNDSLGVSLTGQTDKELIIEMDPIRAGKSVQIEELEFVPGTSQIMESSLPKLRRLRDFLVLNSTLNFEIQGHVYEPGDENSLAGQKMSEARAKRVMKYLENNGIDKKRMTAVGFGNTRPVYIMPRTASEEQANRRVEILIK